MEDHLRGAEFRDHRAHDGQVLAVLRDQEVAEDARRRLMAAGIDGADIRMDAGADRVPSVLAEMQSETENALISPQLGVAWTKEGFKGILALSVVLSVVLSALCVPLMMWAAPDWPVWLNVLTAVIIGVLAGGTIGIVGGAAAARGPAEPLAAEVGVTVRVASTSPEVLEILEASDPIRIDIVLADGSPTQQVYAENPDHSLALEAKRLIHQTDTDWSDAEEQQTAREEGRVAHE